MREILIKEFSSVTESKYSLCLFLNSMSKLRVSVSWSFLPEAELYQDLTFPYLHTLSSSSQCVYYSLGHLVSSIVYIENCSNLIVFPFLSVDATLATLVHSSMDDEVDISNSSSL